MESSTVLAFRIFVMLSCLIIVPMAAIFGSAFPDVVKSVLVDRIVALSTGKPVESKTTDTTGFGEVRPASSATAEKSWEAPRWGAQSNATAWQAPGMSAPGGVIPAAATSVQTGRDQAASFSAPGESGYDARASFPPSRPAVETPRGPMPPGPQGPGRVAPPPAQPSWESQPRGSMGQPQPEPPDRFAAIERKLRGYGATYYLLEAWGNNGETYRFHCTMAVSNNPGDVRSFEATDRDAVKAMSQVLERVEAWRAGRMR